MASSAEWAHAGFALGYAQFGSFPVSDHAKVACLAAQESASRFDSPSAHLILEAGRTEGKRSARETAHRKLYDFHTAALGAVIARILKRLDLDTIAHDVVQHSQFQDAALSDPVTRRRAVQGIALAAILAQVHGADRQEIDGLNADGWAHATAYGQAEAQAGGPPDPAKVAAAAALILAQIDSGTADSAVMGWTTVEFQALAMAAALAAGNGADLGEATRKVKAALVDTGRATKAYADQLHAAVTQAYVNRTQAQTPGVLYNWVTADNPCDECIDNELASPYEYTDLPEYPAHPNCLCDIEAVAAALIDA